MDALPLVPWRGASTLGLGLPPATVPTSHLPMTRDAALVPVHHHAGVLVDNPPPRLTSLTGHMVLCTLPLVAYSAHRRQ
jgi:hypothetical protein